MLAPDSTPEKHIMLIASSGAVEAALAAMRKHHTLPDVVGETCLLLSTLAAGDPDVKRAFVDAEGVRETCLALTEHESDPWVQTQALTVLWVVRHSSALHHFSCVLHLPGFSDRSARTAADGRPSGY